MTECEKLRQAIADYQQRWASQGFGRAYGIEIYTPEALAEYAGGRDDGWAGVVHCLLEELGVLAICQQQPLGPGARPYREGLDGKEAVLQAALQFAQAQAQEVTP